jgi:site-specific DNA recombinase
VGLTEAAMMHDLYQRLADGSSGIAEAARFQALGVPLTRYYTNGRQSTSASNTWHARRITFMIQNPIYKGAHTYKSRFGPIERTVPALVSPELWEAANAQLRRNQALPKGNATRLYLLQGLIRCGLCRKAYVGQRATPATRRIAHYYRCNGGRSSGTPVKAARCKGRVVNAHAIETHVWQRCRHFVLHPDEVVAELARQQAQMPALDEMTAREQALSRHLAEKQQEEERLLTLFRRGRITLQVFEAEQDTIDAERKVLQEELTALHARHKRYHARLDYFARSEALLARWRTDLVQIEAADDREEMQRLIADLVASITVRPEGVHVVYRFEAAEDGVAGGGDVCVALGSTPRILSGPPTLI